MEQLVFARGGVERVTKTGPIVRMNEAIVGNNPSLAPELQESEPRGE